MSPTGEGAEERGMNLHTEGLGIFSYNCFYLFRGFAGSLWGAGASHCGFVAEHGVWGEASGVVAAQACACGSVQSAGLVVVGQVLSCPTAWGLPCRLSRCVPRWQAGSVHWTTRKPWGQLLPY